MGPLKTDPPLVVDADAILTLPIALQWQLRLMCETGKFLDVFAISKTPGFAIPVTHDHLENSNVITCYVKHNSTRIHERKSM